MRIYRRKDLRALIDDAARPFGTVRAFGRSIGISESFLSLVRAGKREPGQRLIRALGLEVTYVKRKPRR